ncbi:MAG: hypothetical protein HYX53_14380 [Chloroflexi bacterium]|nr:hypothetical protein [Chloroflexota bacterium]
MDSGTGFSEGVRRDVRIVRGRAWLFVPAFALGVLLVFASRQAAGASSATASLTLDTTVHTLVDGGDRGLRIYEAQGMTRDDRFKLKVAEATGVPGFDYSRFAISLAPESVEEGVSRGALTVTIADASKLTAEKYVRDFVRVFTEEYTAPEGLFRQRYIDSKRAVAAATEKEFEAASGAARRVVEGRGMPFDELARENPDFLANLNRKEAELTGELAQVAATLTAGTPTGLAATGLLGRPVGDAEAPDALQARRQSLEAAITDVRAQRAALSETAMDAVLLGQLDNLRALGRTRNESAVRLSNAIVTAADAETDLAVTYSASKAVGDTLQGRIALIIVVTLIAGLGGIFLLEWLAQPPPDVSRPRGRRSPEATGR